MGYIHTALPFKRGQVIHYLIHWQKIKAQQRILCLFANEVLNLVNPAIFTSAFIITLWKLMPNTPKLMGTYNKKAEGLMAQLPAW